MDLPQIKQQLIEQIQASTDAVLMIELLDMVKQHNLAPNMTPEQRQYLRERINLVEEGNVVYLNAREEAEKIKKGLREI